MASAALGLAAALLLTGGVATTAADHPLPHWPNTSLNSAGTTLTRLESSPSSAATAGSYSSDWLLANPPPDLGVQAQAGALLDIDSRRVLWESHSRERRAPASLTKMVTAMVALDHALPETSVHVPPEAANHNPDWTNMGLDPGERLTVRELLYGIFLVSGNDAAETLARTLMPRDAFIEAMNAKVRELGLPDTHFANPTGLDEDGHSSSAFDLAVIAGELELHYPDAVAVAAAADVALPASAEHKEYRLHSLNKLLTWPYPGGTGLKTGYTEAAGGCVAGSAARDGRRLVAVVLNSDTFFSDAARLFDYGFGRTPGN